MNYKIILHTLGLALIIESAGMLLPVICAICYGDMQDLLIYSLCALLCLAVGATLTIIKPKNKTMYSREGFVIAALTWIVISLFGAIPFWISGYIPSYIDALFETVSGFTTTGASILPDVGALSNAHLLWRSFTHWIGGMGVLVFIMAVIPHDNGSTMYVLRAESPGPSVGKLVPKLKSSAKILYLIYVGLTFIQVIFMLFGKASLFEALTLTFGTAGTGGFALTNASIADYSPYIQKVITVFMILFGIDFSLYYLILTRKISSFFKSEEVRVYILIILISALVISLNTNYLYPNFNTSLRHGFFQVASIITTTGYTTTDFDIWPALSKTILVILMFVGACAGSTGGGIKVSRILILFKSIRREIKLAAHPKATHKITMNAKSVDEGTVRSVCVYFGVFMALFALSVLIISFDNFDPTTNFTAVAATVNNVGPGLSLVGPTRNYAEFSNLSKIVLSLDMLIGRLEIFPILMLFSPGTWRR